MTEARSYLLPMSRVPVSRISSVSLACRAPSPVTCPVYDDVVGVSHGGGFALPETFKLSGIGCNRHNHPYWNIWRRFESDFDPLRSGSSVPPPATAAAVLDGELFSVQTMSSSFSGLASSNFCWV